MTRSRNNSRQSPPSPILMATLSVLASTTSLVAVTLLAYPLLVPQQNRAAGWIYGRANRYNRDSGLRGKYVRVIRGPAPGTLHLGWQYKAKDDNDKLEYDKLGRTNEERATKEQVFMFWTDRTFAVIGISIATVSAAVALVAAIGPNI